MSVNEGAQQERDRDLKDWARCVVPAVQRSGSCSSCQQPGSSENAVEDSHALLWASRLGRNRNVGWSGFLIASASGERSQGTWAGLGLAGAGGGTRQSKEQRQR